METVAGRFLTLAVTWEPASWRSGASEEGVEGAPPADVEWTVEAARSYALELQTQLLPLAEGLLLPGALSPSALLQRYRQRATEELTGLVKTVSGAGQPRQVLRLLTLLCASVALVPLAAGRLRQPGLPAPGVGCQEAGRVRPPPPFPQTLPSRRLTPFSRLRVLSSKIGRQLRALDAQGFRSLLTLVCIQLRLVVLRAHTTQRVVKHALDQMRKRTREREARGAGPEEEGEESEEGQGRQQGEGHRATGAGTPPRTPPVELRAWEHEALEREAQEVADHVWRLCQRHVTKMLEVRACAGRTPALPGPDALRRRRCGRR